MFHPQHSLFTVELYEMPTPCLRSRSRPASRAASSRFFLSRKILRRILQLRQHKMEELVPGLDYTAVLEPSHPQYSTLRCPVRGSWRVVNADEVQTLIS